MKSRRGFTLIEMMVVLAIIVTLSMVSGPALRGTMDAIRLTGGANQLIGGFSTARQTAISRNLPVEVRLYQEGTGGNWTSVGVVIPASVSGRDHDEWIGKVEQLPGGIVLDPSSEKFSTLLKGNTEGSPEWPQLGKEESSGNPILVRGKDYVAFRFLADGSTNLPFTGTSTDTSWCLTLRNSAGVGASETSPGKNFVSIVIDSQTGRSLIYQP